jgi:hypothetical protein
VTSGALCLVEGRPDDWFTPSQYPAAAAVCNRCPVRFECVAGALQSGVQYGVFGGVDLQNPHTRSRLRKKYGIRRDL